MTNLRRDENVYGDDVTGWVAEFSCFDGSWQRLGVYGSRDAAMAAIVRSRGKSALGRIDERRQFAAIVGRDPLLGCGQ